MHELQVHQIELEMQNAELEQHRQHLEALVNERTHALEASNRRLSDTQIAMDRVGIGIRWAHAGTGRFIYVNRAGAQLLGYSVEEMLRLGVTDVEPDQKIDRLHAMVRDADGDRGARYETTNLARGGGSLPVEVTVYHLPEDAELPARFIAFVTDIRERKRWEASLIEARRAAEAASRAKSNFLANMSHELRTPLNAILGSSYLLRRESTDPRDTPRLDAIDAAGRHLRSLIEVILDLARIDTGQVSLARAPLDLAQIVRETVASVAQRADAKSLRIDVDAGTPPPPLLGDAARLRQALSNYLANAIEFTDAGTITVGSRWDALTKGEVRVRFEVTDTGVGISPQDAARLFADFEQVDNSSTRAHGGAGIGLSITRRLARLMGGDAGLSSVPGRGSTFWFTARLAVAAPAAAGLVDPAPVPGGD